MYVILQTGGARTRALEVRGGTSGGGWMASSWGGQAWRRSRVVLLVPSHPSPGALLRQSWLGGARNSVWRSSWVLRGAGECSIKAKGWMRATQASEARGGGISSPPRQIACRLGRPPSIVPRALFTTPGFSSTLRTPGEVWASISPSLGEESRNLNFRGTICPRRLVSAPAIRHAHPPPDPLLSLISTHLLAIVLLIDLTTSCLHEDFLRSSMPLPGLWRRFG